MIDENKLAELEHEEMMSGGDSDLREVLRLARIGLAWENGRKANKVIVGSKSNMSFSMDPNIPPNEIQIRLNDEVIGKLINLQ